MNQNTASVNFCPGCGCNIRAVLLALQLSSGREAEPRPVARETPPIDPQRARLRPGPKPGQNKRISFSPDERDEIRRRVVAGEKPDQIAREKGVHLLKIQYILKPKKSGPQASIFTPEMVAEIEKRRAQGESREEACLNIGVSEMGYASYLRRQKMKAELEGVNV